MHASANTGATIPVYPIDPCYLEKPGLELLLVANTIKAIRAMATWKGHNSHGVSALLEGYTKEPVADANNRGDQLERRDLLFAYPTARV